MAALDKDTAQKEKAIRYCISNGILPYLEVIVNNVREITDVRTVITDLDVLGLEVSRRGNVQRTLFDCKTVGKMSAINRAFWAAGVMAYIGCNEAYVILTKKATEAHRVSAKTLNVHLFQESDFEKYAESANINYLDRKNYSAHISAWHSYYYIFEKNEPLKTLGEYINTRIPLEIDFAKSLRELLGIVRINKGELNPDKNEHMSVYCSIVLSFLLVMIPITSQLADIFDSDMNQSDYEKVLRYYVWGGRDSYIQRRDLKNSVQEVSGGKKGELELPGWERFVEVSRGLLESPVDIKEALIPCRELSLRYISDNDVYKDFQLSVLLRRSNRIVQFMIAASGYLYSSAGLPKDFHDIFKEEVSLLLELKSPNVLLT
ncbi:TPA: hypothetical protein ACYEOW_004619 [Raoultella terrigena]|uniref:Uncharacterized protein n=1 Tax=Raoultella terrigena TaxID=577 RepID=A0AAP9XR00_RAOTE|nr:hypothetical protein [Raoultella terrigena]QPF09537.1 hypothetical protein IMO34_03605 [Raoultella terrigena]